MQNLLVANIQKRMEWLLLGAIFTTFVIAMNYTTHHIGGSGLLMAFNNTTWMGFASILFFGILMIVGFTRIIISKVFLAYLFCLITLLFPVIFSDSPVPDDFYLTIAALVSWLILVFIFQQNMNMKFKYQVLMILFFSSLVQTVWGLVQYYFIFENGPLFMRADVGIPYGTFSQKNVFSSYLALGSLISLYFLFSLKQTSKILIAFTFLLILLNAHLSMLAETRTGRVVPIIAVAIYLGYCGFKYKRKMLSVALVLACLSASFMPKQWFDPRPEQIVNAPLGIQSIGLRPIMYQLGVDMVSDKPLRGYGLGNQTYEFTKRKVDYEQRNSVDLKNLGITEHIHNEPLHWAMQLGVISGGAFLLLFVVWCVGLFKGWLDPTILMLALPLVGHALLEYPFYHSAPHLLAFAIILGLAVKETYKTIEFSPVLSGVIVPLVGFISYKVIVFMMMSLAASNALVAYRMGAELDVSLLDSVEPTSTFEPFFTHEKHEWKFKNALKTGKISQQETYDFISFLEAYRKQAPQSILYIQLAELYIIAGQREKANAIMLEARLFFPKDEKVIAYFNGR